MGPIISCLKVQFAAWVRNTSGLENANTEVRKKAVASKDLLGRIMSTDFLLSLSYQTDMFKNFGAYCKELRWSPADT